MNPAIARGVLKFWAAGAVFILAAWLAFIPLMFLQGFFGFLMIRYENIAIVLISTSAYLVITPYILGRLVKWVSEKFFQKD